MTIPTAEYAELLDCRRLVAQLEFQKQRLMTPLRSKVDVDPEVAVFAAERLGQLTVVHVVAKATACFGAGRVPIRSSMFQFDHPFIADGPAVAEPATADPL